MQTKDKILQDLPWLQNALKEAKADALPCEIAK